MTFTEPLDPEFQETFDLLMKGLDVEIAIRELVRREFSLDARIKRAVKNRKRRRHLTHFRRMVKTLELQAA